jgi:hypothetical protein
MKRYRVLVTVMLAAMALIAACTSSDDTADETTTAAPATTVAPPETATTAAAATSTTVSPSAAIATVEAFINARNAHDADAIAAFFTESAWEDEFGAVGTPSWEQGYALEETRGWRGTLVDCQADDGEVTCLVDSEDTLLSGKAGVVYTSEWQFRFDDQGLIAHRNEEILTGGAEDSAFDDALGLWMMTAYPESLPTFYEGEGHYSNAPAGVGTEEERAKIELRFRIRWREENWSTPEGVAELSPLIDEFVAQSDVYPLGN